MVTITESDREFILEITNAMQSRCDGARTEDGVGFNKFDSNRVQSMGSELNPKFLAFVLIKYKTQIISMGFDYDRLISITTSINQNKPKMSKKLAKMTISGDNIVLETPYNEDFKSFVKGLGGRYNPDNKSWSVSKGYIQEVTVAFERTFKDMDMQMPNLSDMVSGTIYCNGIKEDVLVQVAYNRDFIDYIKSVESFNRNRKWDAEHKAWRLSVSNKEIVDDIFKMANQFNIGFSEDAEKNLNEIITYFDERVKMSASSNAEMTINGLGGTLYPFQTAGVQFADELDGRVLIADEMGLGKTVQALAWLQHHPEVRPAIIIVPACVKTNWQRETQKWLSKGKIVVVNGGKAFDTTGDITIINYDIVKKHQETLKSMKAKCVIMDECHYTKNYKAQRTKAVQDIVRGIPHVFALSGTPILNKPIELWTIANMVAPKTFHNWRTYVDRYCNARQERWGLDVSGASNLGELQELLRQTMMIRRVKTDVLKELPPKRRETVFMNISESDRVKYDNMVSMFRSWVRENSKSKEEADAKLTAEALVKINEMRKMIAGMKMDSVKEWISNYMEASTGKLVLFCHHLATIEAMKKAYPDILVVSGDMDTTARQKSIDAFQNDDTKRLIILTFGAGGVGITLTKAQDVAFIELAWRPADLSQAEDRIHRIGQEGNVTAWYLLAPDTIDEMMMEMINEKAKISSQTLDIDVDSSIQRNIISMFMKED